MYVDFDYESIEPMTELIKDKECCFSLEPEIHSPRRGELFFNNAMMLSVPEHFFMKKIISSVFMFQFFSMVLLRHIAINFFLVNCYP